MQDFRQSEARLGETACVIGLGLVGQLSSRSCAPLASTSWASISTERCGLAERSGRPPADPRPGQPGPALEALAALTDGAGADHVFLTAGGDTNQPVELAAELARDRARVVDIGKCRLDLPWTEYYAKELEVRFWRSYGPGRYDPTYEEDGVDYPIGYVRWTERRNMACSWTWWPRVGSTWTSSSPRCCRSTTRSAPTSGSSAGSRAASACCSATRPTGRRRAGRPSRPSPIDRPAGRSRSRWSGSA